MSNANQKQYIVSSSNKNMHFAVDVWKLFTEVDRMIAERDFIVDLS